MNLATFHGNIYKVYGMEQIWLDEDAALKAVALKGLGVRVPPAPPLD